MDLRYGSDVVVELLRELDIEYVAFNPGASFRGLHDSLVNWPGAPEHILCTHENVAVQVAHGYAKATGRPMAVVLHDVVGLLNAAMALFYARIDRVPLLALGGSGPVDAVRRRPEIDWRHTANVQANAIREFVKWDDQPASVDAFGDSLIRAHRLTSSEPAGPVYVALDVDLQEEKLRPEFATPAVDAYPSPSRLAPEPTALARAAEHLVSAERPLIVADFCGRDPLCFEQLPRLAELLGAPVIDTATRLSMPTAHPLNGTGGESELVKEADVVLLLDAKDVGRTLHDGPTEGSSVRSRLRADAQVVEVGFGDLGISSWVVDHGAHRPAALRVTADTRIALPMLLDAVTESLSGEKSDRAQRRDVRRRQLGEAHASRRERWASEAAGSAGRSPVATAHLASAVWNVVRSHDWVLTAGDASGWARRLWDFDRPYRHPGASLGTATQIGISLGVALAHRGSGRLIVDLQPDGDLLYHPAALWTAVAHRIPILVVMFNNRAYYNDWNHQLSMAKLRGTPPERAREGIALDQPSTDFATLARAFGWWSDGPIDDASAVEQAVARAADVVLSEGRPALVDVVCEYR
ncbi:MAG: thiamine pyrophosphate-binding protein [Candidatus Limnocylindrales bacterium]